MLHKNSERRPSAGSRSRRLLGLSAVAAGLALLGYATLYERHRLLTTEPILSLPRLAPALEGLRVVQISDLHFGHFAEASYIRELVRRVNNLAPDLVLLTGDIVSERTLLSRRRSARMSYRCAEILAGIDCPHRWSVLGNHDELVGPAIVTRALEQYGFPVLNNGHSSFERNGARLWLAGLASSSEGAPDLAAAVPARLQNASDAVLLLAHEPDFANIVDAHGGVDLMLSGHTHGGQVRLPLVGALKLPPMGKKYVAGLFRFHGGLQLYVNRGVGAQKLPVRFRCPPELTLLTLRRAPETNS